MKPIRALDTVLPRPLDPVRSIKIKLGMLTIVSGAAGMAYFWYRTNSMPLVTSIVAIGVALLTTQLLAHGMTRPLRQMTAAARAMARGDYSRRVQATSRDEVGELAVAFNHMAADLAAADRQRRELIANVSHELRTPIAAVQAVLENIVDGVEPPDEVSLRTALVQTERLGRLVTDLLDLSRIDAGAHRLELRGFRVRAFIDEVLAEATAIASNADRDISFTALVRPGDATIVGDRDRLKQVVLNLLDNAARHSPSGGVVSVIARAQSPGIVLEVRDDGPGIARPERDRVFERFSRGERATGGGTGLGLAIARWVVELHGGTVVVADTGHGCLIRVTLPALPAPPVTPISPATSVPGAVPARAA